MNQRMAFVLFVLVAGVGMAVFAGCGPGNDGRGDQIFASEIQDGAEKYDRSQYACPVCEGQPISGEYYAEVDGKRIYFDQQSCMEQFKENPDQYLGDMPSMKQKRMKQMQQRRQGRGSGGN